jgi:superoxide dismutase, Fe-Mn family
LRYPTSAPAPVIDDDTMQLHHGKHHQAYVDALNNAMEPNLDLRMLAVEDLMRQLDKLPGDIRSQVRNNGGGHANHDLFVKTMQPGGSVMPDALGRNIN